MNCTDCDFAAKIMEAGHLELRYEDTPCATCELKEDSAHTLAFDEERAEREDGGRRSPCARYCGSAAVENGEQSDDPVLPLSVLAEALRGFLELPPRTFRIVQRRMKGDTYALIGKELNISPGGVEIQLRRALEAHPHLKHLLPEKARRQAARKRKRLCMARRGTLGGGRL